MKTIYSETLSKNRDMHNKNRSQVTRFGASFKKNRNGRTGSLEQIEWGVSQYLSIEKSDFIGYRKFRSYQMRLCSTYQHHFEPELSL